MKVLAHLYNTLEVASRFNTKWESEFGKAFPIGSSAQIKLPQRWLVTNGLAYQPQGIARLSTTINLDQVFGIHFEWDSYERLVKMERSEEELENQYLFPAGKQLAQEVDSRAANWAHLYTSNFVGTLGTDPTSLAPFTAAEVRLFQKAVAKGLDKDFCLSPTMMKSYVDNNVTQFNPQKAISDMYRTGLVGEIAGMRFFRSNSLIAHTVGTAPAHSVTVTGANQSGGSLIVTGTASDVINPGDKFTIASVNAVNPATRQKGTLSLMNFVYSGAAPFTLTGGSDTISILPAIFGPGSQYQNVDSLPANSAALTFFGTSGQVGTISLVLTELAFAIAYGKFEKPTAVERSDYASDPETGAEIRFVRSWDQHESKMTNRWDMACGFGNLYQDNGAVAVLGA